MDDLSLETFKIRLDQALRNLIELVGVPVDCRGVGLEDLWESHPTQNNSVIFPPYILVI